MRCRNYNHWIETVDKAMWWFFVHDIPQDRILEQVIDREDPSTLFQILERPTLAMIRSKMMRSLQASKPSTRRFQDIPYPRPGTFGGILDVPVGGLEGQSMRDWVQSLSRGEHRVCWITGEAGSGKSVLMKHLVSTFRTEPLLLLDVEDWRQRGLFCDDMRQEHPRSYEAVRDCTTIMMPHILAHFFDYSNRTVQGDRIQNMLLDLLRQLFEQDPVTIDSVCYPAVSDDASYQALDRPSLEWDPRGIAHLWYMALADCRRRSKPVFIFLDLEGKDRIGEEEWALITWLIQRYTKADHERNNYHNVKIVVAARKEGLFKKWNWPVTIKLESSAEE